MIEGEDILCFGPGDWWHMNPSCTTHIMRQFARQNRVLYVNPFSADLSGGLRRGVQRRILRKIKSIARSFRRESRNLATFSPVFFPWQGHRLIDSLNDRSVHLQIATVLPTLHMRPSLLWIENPRAADALDWFPRVASVYHVSDSFWECPYTRDKQALRLRDQRLTDGSSCIICVSDDLYQSKATARDGSVWHVGHGVDYQRFAEAAARGVTSPYVEGLPRPIVGYFGTLTAQNDIPLLEYCARSAPELTFVFAGTITAGDYQPLLRLPNTHFPGQVPYEMIPELAASFDVCLLPWRQSDWIRHCNPLKTYEYLASGRPIVSIPIPEVIRLSNELIHFASTPADFLAAIRKSLVTESADRARARQALAATRSWESHHRQLCQIIGPLLSEQRGAA